MMSVWQAVCGHQFVYESLGQKNKKICQKHDGVTTELRKVMKELRRSYEKLTELRKVMTELTLLKT